MGIIGEHFWCGCISIRMHYYYYSISMKDERWVSKVDNLVIFHGIGNSVFVPLQKHLQGMSAIPRTFKNKRIRLFTNTGSTIQSKESFLLSNSILCIFVRVILKSYDILTVQTRSRAPSLGPPLLHQRIKLQISDTVLPPFYHNKAMV